MGHPRPPIQIPRELHMILSEDNPSEDNPTCSSMDASPIGGDSTPLEGKARPEEVSPFERGFRVGRAEGMIALIDAMTEARPSSKAMRRRPRHRRGSVRIS